MAFSPRRDATALGSDDDGDVSPAVQMRRTEGRPVMKRAVVVRKSSSTGTAALAGGGSNAHGGDTRQYVVAQLEAPLLAGLARVSDVLACWSPAPGTEQIPLSVRHAVAFVTHALTERAVAELLSSAPGETTRFARTLCETVTALQRLYSGAVSHHVLRTVDMQGDFTQAVQSVNAAQPKRSSLLVAITAACCLAWCEANHASAGAVLGSLGTLRSVVGRPLWDLAVARLSDLLTLLESDAAARLLTTLSACAAVLDNPILGRSAALGMSPDPATPQFGCWSPLMQWSASPVNNGARSPL
jgi:hypothetical protein